MDSIQLFIFCREHSAAKLVRMPPEFIHVCDFLFAYFEINTRIDFHKISHGSGTGKLFAHFYLSLSKHNILIDIIPSVY